MTAVAEYRLFVALTAPELVRREVEKAQAELRACVPQARVTWTRREQFHLTLKFLGNVEGERAGGLVEAVRGAASGFAPLRLRAEGVGCFPDLRSPRVVWLGVRDLRGGAAPIAARDRGGLRQFHRPGTAGTIQRAPHAGPHQEHRTA